MAKTKSKKAKGAIKPFPPTVFVGRAWHSRLDADLEASESKIDLIDTCQQKATDAVLVATYSLVSIEVLRLAVAPK
ncbi:MAG TPA: hypothetical protein VJP78_13380 [Thermoleophilia bacterium]|nr:hypothetical protein [Thermoleophilia bacterium]